MRERGQIRIPKHRGEDNIKLDLQSVGGCELDPFRDNTKY